MIIIAQSECLEILFIIWMQFTPNDCLIFSYKQDSHLPTSLHLRNTASTACPFKFKVTTTNKFYINPSLGVLKPGAEAKVSIVIHRDIVDRLTEEKIQIMYGDQYQESRYFELLVENGSRNDQLNLTVIVKKKEEEKVLKHELEGYRKAPPNNSSPAKKGQSGMLVYILVAIVGVFLGYFSPITLL